MVVRKDDLHVLIDRLQEPDRKAAFDFLQFLVKRSEKTTSSWGDIDGKQPDDEPLSEEALQQLTGNSGYLSGEAAKREFGLQVDLP